MSLAMINPTLLRWARERVGYSQAQVAYKIGVKEQIFSEWEKEDRKIHPTFNQAQGVARTLHIPFGYLYLSTPPQVVSPIADFRTSQQSRHGYFSPDLEATINDARRKQDWLREWRIQEGNTQLLFVGRFSMSSPPSDVAEDIRKTIKIPQTPDKEIKSREDFLHFLVRQAEESGILVLQNSVVQNNTHRPLSVEEFKGFTLSDTYSPLIFLNSRDYIAGRIFTLAHELAHLWIGSTGISDSTPSPENPSNVIDIERFCNQVAAELLVPRQYFSSLWKKQGVNNTLDIAQRISDVFLVSVFVVLIQALDSGLISLDEYFETKTEASGLVSPPKSSSKDGGKFFYNIRARNGRIFISELATALHQGNILYREAAQLLNVQPKVIDGIVKEIRGGL